MLLVKISYREQPDDQEVHQFTAKVTSSLEAIHSFYDQHPKAVWLGVRSTPLLDEAV